MEKINLNEIPTSLRIFFNEEGLIKPNAGIEIIFAGKKISELKLLKNQLFNFIQPLPAVPVDGVLRLDKRASALMVVIISLDNFLESIRLSLPVKKLQTKTKREDLGKIAVGDTITFWQNSSDEAIKDSYTLVLPENANIYENKLSIETASAKALLGKQVGQPATWKVGNNISSAIVIQIVKPNGQVFEIPNNEQQYILKRTS